MPLSYRSIPRYGLPTVSVPIPPLNCWSPPAPIPTGCATRPPSPRCAGRPQSQHPRAKSPATDSPAAGTGQPTMPSTASRWCACRATPRPATTSGAKPPTAAPKRDSAATQTRHRPRNIQTAHPPRRDRRLPRPAPSPRRQKHHPKHRRHPFRRPTDHRLPARTRTPTQRHPRQQLPPMADRRLTS